MSFFLCSAQWQIIVQFSIPSPAEIELRLSIRGQLRSNDEERFERLTLSKTYQKCLLVLKLKNNTNASGILYLGLPKKNTAFILARDFKFEEMLRLYHGKGDCLTLTRPLRRNLRMSWFFDVSKLKESRFFLIGPHWPPSRRFLMRIFWKISIEALSVFIFQWVFTSRSVLSQMVI